MVLIHISRLLDYETVGTHEQHLHGIIIQMITIISEMILSLSSGLMKLDNQTSILRVMYVTNSMGNTIRPMKNIPLKITGFLDFYHLPLF
jgi:hypothetical protein